MRFAAIRWQVAGPAEYNDGMGALAAVEIDTWLREGGLVVTASDRAARALAASFHRARRAEGLAAWPAPNILDWKSFARAAWEQRSTGARLLLNPAQEQKLWVEIAGEERAPATALEGPRHRLAALAMEAHELLCSYAPRFLRPAARAGWQQDAAAFSGWLAAFDEICRTESLLSPSRLPHELIPLLECGTGRSARRCFWPALTAFCLSSAASSTPGASGARLLRTSLRTRCVSMPPPMLRLKSRLARSGAAGNSPPTRRRACWSSPRLPARGAARSSAPFCATPARRLSFRWESRSARLRLARAAHLMLRWLDGTLNEQELDWLLSTGHAAASAQETCGAAMRSCAPCAIAAWNERSGRWRPSSASGCASELLPGALG